MAVLPDVLPIGLRVVFCGTQAGAVSAQRGVCYGGPGNKFWRILDDVGLTPVRLSPTDFSDLPRYGIGLTDVAKATSGSDNVLLRSHFDVDGFMARIKASAPAIVAFNGKRAAQVVLGVSGPSLSYGWQSQKVFGAVIFVLPSTSGAAAGYWSIEPWRELANAVIATKASS